MAFPTTNVLEDCSRVENPLSNGGRWSSPIDPGSSSFQADGSTAFSAGAGYASMWWNVAVVADGEAFVKSPGGGDNYLYFRCQAGTIGTALNNYVLNWSGGGTAITLRYYASGSATFLQSFTVAAIQAGDEIGARFTGLLIEVFLNGASQGIYDTTPDATKYSTGFIGFESNVTSAGWTNFGGGAPSIALTNIDLTRFPKEKLRTVVA